MWPSVCCSKDARHTLPPSLSSHVHMTTSPPSVFALQGERFARLTIGGAQNHITDSLATFMESDDLICHMLELIPERYRADLTLVCKTWMRRSYMIPSWRRACLRVDFSYDASHWTPGGLSSLESIKDIFTERRHIKSFHLSG